MEEIIRMIFLLILIVNVPLVYPPCETGFAGPSESHRTSDLAFQNSELFQYSTLLCAFLVDATIQSGPILVSTSSVRRAWDRLSNDTPPYALADRSSTSYNGRTRRIPGLFPGLP